MTFHQREILNRTGQVAIANQPGFTVTVKNEGRFTGAHRREVEPLSPEEQHEKEVRRIALLNGVLNGIDHPAVRQILITARDTGHTLADVWDAAQSIYREENEVINAVKRIVDPNRDRAVEALNDSDPHVAMLARMVVNAKKKEDKKDDGKLDPEGGETGQNDLDGGSEEAQIEFVKKLYKK